jgi:hypothetical protein
VVNSVTRYPSLGDKLNAAIQASNGQYFARWDDDDLSLPWRLTQAVEQVAREGYWKPPQVWYYPAGEKRLIGDHQVGNRHHASIFSRKAWEAVGGYPSTSGDEDALLDAMLHGETLAAYPAGIPKHQWAYIYRWGVHPHHISGKQDLAAHYREIGEMPSAAGTFTLRPHWREDYVALAKASCAPRFKVCRLRANGSQPNWCERHGQFHEGPVLARCLEDTPEGEEFRQALDSAKTARLMEALKNGEKPKVGKSIPMCVHLGDAILNEDGSPASKPCGEGRKCRQKVFACGNREWGKDTTILDCANNVCGMFTKRAAV